MALLCAWCRHAVTEAELEEDSEFCLECGGDLDEPCDVVELEGPDPALDRVTLVDRKQYTPAEMGVDPEEEHEK